MFTSKEARSNHDRAIDRLRGFFLEYSENNIQKNEFLDEAKTIRQAILQRSGNNQIHAKEYVQRNCDLYAELSMNLGYVAELDVKNYIIRNELAKIFLGWEVPETRIMKESFMQEEKHLALYKSFAGKTNDELLGKMRLSKELAQKNKKLQLEYDIYRKDFSDKYNELELNSSQETRKQEEREVDEIFLKQEDSDFQQGLYHVSGREIKYNNSYKAEENLFSLDEFYQSAEDDFVCQSPLVGANNREANLENPIGPNEHHTDSWFSYIFDRFICHRSDRSSVYIY